MEKTAASASLKAGGSEDKNDNNDNNNNNNNEIKVNIDAIEAGFREICEDLNCRIQAARGDTETAGRINMVQRMILEKEPVGRIFQIRIVVWDEMYKATVQMAQQQHGGFKDLVITSGLPTFEVGNIMARNENDNYKDNNMASWPPSGDQPRMHD